jgi:uncharacterized membrane protein YbaN (DUF454 family)
MWIFGFAARISFCFKEQYKRYYDNLFQENGFHKPYKWGLSRQKNHDVYVTFKWFTILFTILTILFGFFNCDILSLIVIVTLPLVIVLPLGEAIGKHLCKTLVKKECKKFQIPFSKIQNSLLKF